MKVKETQTVFAGVAGISKQRVSSLIKMGVLPIGGTVLEWNHAYIEHLSKIAAGREGGIVDSNIRLNTARAEKIEMENAVARGELIPTAMFSKILGNTGGRVVRILEGIPARLKRSVPGWNAAMSATAKTEIAKALNEVATMNFEDVTGDE